MVFVKNHVLRINRLRGKRAEALKLTLAVHILTIYRSNTSITTSSIVFRIKYLHDMFRPTWPHSSNTQYIQSTWEEINIKLYSNKGYLIITEVIIMCKRLCY